MNVAIAAETLAIEQLDRKGDIEWMAQVDGREVVYPSEPNAGPWRRFTVGVRGLLPVEG
jgi:hypothetical protein